jgi:plasmid maintenance system antidote protein VapI
MVSDMALRGWGIPDLARASGLHYKTTARFVHGEVQTAKTAARLSHALGFSMRRYFSHVEAAA